MDAPCRGVKKREKIEERGQANERRIIFYIHTDVDVAYIETILITIAS